MNMIERLGTRTGYENVAYLEKSVNSTIEGLMQVEEEEASV